MHIDMNAGSANALRADGGREEQNKRKKKHRALTAHKVQYRGDATEPLRDKI